MSALLSAGTFLVVLLSNGVLCRSVERDLIFLHILMGLELSPDHVMPVPHFYAALPSGVGV